MQVRVWNIPEQRVVDWADVHEMVTATAFSPDGRRTVVGTMKGRCRFYQCEPTFKLEYQAQIGELPPSLSMHREHVPTFKLGYQAQIGEAQLFPAWACIGSICPAQELSDY